MSLFFMQPENKKGQPNSCPFQVFKVILLYFYAVVQISIYQNTTTVFTNDDLLV